MKFVGELYQPFFIPRPSGHTDKELDRKQGGGRRVEYEHLIQHGLARTVVHMDLHSKVGTMGWGWDLVDGPLQLPMGWYIPVVGGERMTGRYEELGQLVVVAPGRVPLS